MTAIVLATGLDEFAHLMLSVPDIADEAAFLAVNETSRDSVPAIKRVMRKQINFPSGYLNKKRLDIRRKATRTTLQAVISARDRPTSLARFAEGATVTPRGAKQRPIFVKVKANRQVRLDRAFIIELRNGNLGLAIRLPKGQEPDRAYRPVELTRDGGKGQGAWLLYGPSVEQVMVGAIPEIQPEIQDKLTNNFFRQFTRLTRG